MTNEHCKTCKTGLLQLNNHYNLKEFHTIGRIEFIKRSKKLAERCFPCLYNSTTTKKAKRVQKVLHNFKSLDMSEPTLLSPDSCPICGDQIIGIKENDILYEYCFRDGCKYKCRT